MTCPLCTGAAVHPFWSDRRRDYLRCADCALVHVPPEQRLSAAREKAEYDLHRNDPADAGYRRFLSRLSEPLHARLAAHSEGLDFGCGPGPALAQMLREAGHRVDLFDPFYAPDPAPLARRYDFITVSEVVEHLHQPGQELERLWGCLRSGGLLGIMTKRVRDRDAFARWHYKNDMTHVCFFADATFVWLAERWRARLTVCGPDVVLLQRDA